MKELDIDFDEEYDVVVIGAGIGGLTCAACLAKNGKKVKVFEQHYVPGGCCSSFKRGPFKFDAGVLHLTGGKESGAFKRVLAALEMEDDLEFREQFQRFVFPDLTYDSSRDLESLPSKLRELFPQEETGIVKLFGIIKSIYEDIRQLPTLSPLISQYKNSSFQELLDSYINDVKLKSLISANWHLWHPMWKNSAIDYAALMVTEQLRGYYYPIGGIQTIPDAFVRVLHKHGGEIEYRTFVEKIIVDNNCAIGIETTKGKRVRAAKVVSNVAARSTFFNMVGEDNLPQDFVQTFNKLEISLSSFYVYLGLDIDPRTLGVDAPETIVYESYDNTTEWELLLKGEIAVPCFGISIPTYLDQGLAPPGKHVVIVMMMAPYHLNGKSWREEKKRVTQMLIDKAGMIIPSLSQHIVIKDSATPLTYERYTGNSLGAAMGWAFSPDMFMKRLEQRTPITNLYLAGHWSTPGGGVPAVAISGLRAAQTILGE